MSTQPVHILLVIVAVLAALLVLPSLLRLILWGAFAGFARLRWWWNGCREAAAFPCPACGYDIRETPHRCPECGTKLMWGLLPGLKDLRRKRR